jgi:hypothetical protein
MSSESCPVEGFCISGVETLCSVRGEELLDEQQEMCFEQKGVFCV